MDQLIEIEMDLPQDVKDLVGRLQQERKALVSAWEKLEQEQKRLALDASAPSSKPAVGAPPMPVKNKDATQTGLSKQSQFLRLQREIDRPTL
jgi:hypothetical protein